MLRVFCVRDVPHIYVYICECGNDSDCELRKDARAFRKQGQVPCALTLHH